MLLGKNLPHCWLDYGKNQEEVKAVVIQFAEDCFGKDFLRVPELGSTRRLLEKASMGILFRSPDNNLVKDIGLLPSLSGIQKVISLVAVLGKLSALKPGNFKTLSKIDYTLRSETSLFSRINIVYDFVYQNFKKEIQINKVADLVHMNVSAFCHYFKKSTGKTFTEFVNEIRIGYACKLLIETDLTVAQICFECGYNGLSNFNKVFKIIAQYSPLNYRKAFG